MGADLNNIVKCQKLTDDHVQFLIYQILRGLKVSDTFPRIQLNTGAFPVMYQLLLCQYIDNTKCNFCLMA